MSDTTQATMRSDDFPIDLVSLQLDDYDVVQQQANEQLKGQLIPRTSESQVYGGGGEDLLLLQSTDLLLHNHLSTQLETLGTLGSGVMGSGAMGSGLGEFQEATGHHGNLGSHHGSHGNVFEGLQIETNLDDEMAMEIQQFPTPTGSPAPIEVAPGGYATPLTMSPGSTPSTTPGTTPYNTPGHTPGVTPGHTPGVTPGSSPPGPSPLPSPCSSHPSSPRSHKGHMLMMRGLASLSAPYTVTSAATSSSGGKDVSKPQKIPRHKRQSHINAEHRRRSKIQLGFDELSSMVPAISEITQSGTKDSKAGMLNKTVDYCRQLRTEYKTLASQADVIRREIQQLTGEIKIYQSQLPAAGVAVQQSAKSPEQSTKCEDMFEDYVKAQSRVNWKFWIFGLVIRPLFESYNASVTTTTTEEFSQGVLSWLEEHCSLVNLRPVVFNALRHLSTATSVMDTPERLPQEAKDAALKVEPRSRKSTGSASSNPASPSTPSR